MEIKPTTGTLLDRGWMADDGGTPRNGAVLCLGDLGFYVPGGLDCSSEFGAT